MVMSDARPSIAELLEGQRVIPVVEVVDVPSAVGAATALVSGGLRVIEIVMRTPAALDAISAIRESVGGVTVGAGTVRSAADLRAASAVGAEFLVSPGSTDELLDAADGTTVPFLPGVATPTEVLRALARGYRVQKLYPAALLGGVAMIAALATIAPEVSFIPTGGIRADDVDGYLATGGVLAVGASFVCSPALIARRAWDEITAGASTIAQHSR